MKKNIFLLFFKIIILCIVFFNCQGLMMTTESESNDSSKEEKSKNQNEDYLVFKDEAEVQDLLNELNEVTIAERKSIDKLKNFTSMLDVFMNIKNISNEKEMKLFFKENEKFLVITNTNINGQDIKIANLKLDFLNSCIVNKDGYIKIGDKLYNFLSQIDIRSTERLGCFPVITNPNMPSDLVDFPSSIPSLPNLVSPYSDTVVPSNILYSSLVSNILFMVIMKEPVINPCIDRNQEYYSYLAPGINPFGLFAYFLALRIPMSILITTPVYPTIHYQTEVNGKACTVQLWKGHLIENGIGAEIGIYTPNYNISPLWFPDPANFSTQMSYELKYNDETIVSMSANTWWLNKWKIKNLIDLPYDGNEYTLIYTIKGHKDGENRIWKAHSSTAEVIANNSTPGSSNSTNNPAPSSYTLYYTYRNSGYTSGSGEKDSYTTSYNVNVGQKKLISTAAKWSVTVPMRGSWTYPFSHWRVDYGDVAFDSSTSAVTNIRLRSGGNASVTAVYSSTSE